MPRNAVSNRTRIPTFQNLLTYSEQFDNAIWTKQTNVIVTADQATNPIDGAMTADLLDLTTASSSTGTYQTITSIKGAKYTFSVWMRTVSGTGTVELADGGGAGSKTITITNSWDRYSFSFTALTTTGSILAQIRKSVGGVNTLYIFGAQLVLSTNNPGPYQVTTTTAVNTGPLRGIVPATQNLLLYSEQFDNAAWTKISGATVTPNTATAPDGTLTADTLAFASGSQFVQQNYTVPTPRGFWRFGVYLKADSPVNVYVYIRDNSGGAPGGIPLITANVTTSWQLFEVGANIYSDVGIGAIIAGISPAVSVYAWGAQLVHTNWMPPYIQTTSAIYNIGAPRLKVSNRVAIT